MQPGVASTMYTLAYLEMTVRTLKCCRDVCCMCVRRYIARALPAVLAEQGIAGSAAGMSELAEVGHS